MSWCRRTIVAVQVHNHEYFSDGGRQFDDPENMRVLARNVATLLAHFDEVFLVAPDSPENQVFFGIQPARCHLGSKEDVGRRICDALSSKGDGDIVIRTFAEQVLDVDLVKLQVKKLVEGRWDYVSPPEGRDHPHGAEVFSLEALRRAVRFIEMNGMEEHRIRPYFLMRHLDGIRWAPLDTPRAFFRSLRTEQVRQKPGLFQTENLGHYRFIRDQCTRSDSVLEMGCGNGAGGSIVGERAQDYMGVDLAPMNIIHAKKHHENDRVKFVHADVLSFQPSRLYNKVVCLYVLPCMEGTADEKRLIRVVGRHLVPGGIAYFATTLWKDPQDGRMNVSRFRDLLSERFGGIEIKGLDKGFFVEEQEAREAAFAICTGFMDG